MATKVKDIKNAVKAALDEIGVNDASFLAGVDNVNLDKLIESKIDDAIQMIYQSADEALLDTESVEDEYVETTTVHDTAREIVFAGPVVKVYLTDKFLRFVSARITKLTLTTVLPDNPTPLIVDMHHEWAYPVYQFIPSTSADYAKLKNPYTTGTEERPKAGFTITPSVEIGSDTLTSVRTLELYSLTDTQVDKEDDTEYEFKAEVDCQVIYRRERTLPSDNSTASDNDTYEIGPKLLRPVIYYIAGLVLQAWKDEHADSMINIALTMAGVDTRNQQLK